MNTKPNIFDYLDYRKYLKDYYDYMKSVNPEFSYRYFAKIAKLKALNYLKLVIIGDIHLTTHYRSKFAKGCGFTSEETKYFYKLIEFTKSKDIKEKNKNLVKLSKLSTKLGQKELRDEQYRLLTKWYNVVVRSLVTTKDFSPDPKEMARKLKGFVSPKEAEEALNMLLQNGFIKNQNGQYKLTDKHLSSKDEVLLAAGRNFHSQMIPVGIKALQDNSLEDREIRAVTLGITHANALKAKQRIKEFYKELVLELTQKDTEVPPEEIWQLNLQFFNFTRNEKQ